MTGIDRELLRDLDRHLGGPQIDTPPTAPEAHMALPPRADISGVLEAIQFAASSMNATAEHIEQLEAHSKAFDAANQELEARTANSRCSLAKRYRSVMRLQQALKPRRSARSVSRALPPNMSPGGMLWSESLPPRRLISLRSLSSFEQLRRAA